MIPDTEPDEWKVFISFSSKQSIYMLRPSSRFILKLLLSDWLIHLFFLLCVCVSAQVGVRIKTVEFEEYEIACNKKSTKPARIL